MVAILSVGTLLAVACGGGEKLSDLAGEKAKATVSVSTQAAPGDIEAPTEPDSGTSDSRDTSGSSTVSTSAADYASEVCGAVAKYATDIQDLTNATTDIEDVAAMKDFVDQMRPLFEKLADDLDKIKPPSDVEDWHNNLVTGLNDAADIMDQMSAALEKPLEEAMTDFMDLSTRMNDMEDPFTLSDLPDEYQAAFNENPDCQDLSSTDIFSQ